MHPEQFDGINMARTISEINKGARDANLVTRLRDLLQVATSSGLAAEEAYLAKVLQEY